MAMREVERIKQIVANISPSTLKTGKVFFISLVATDSETGLPAKENYLFDIATELELYVHGVTFVSTQSLKRFHEEKLRQNDESFSPHFRTYWYS